MAKYLLGLMYLVLCGLLVVFPVDIFISTRTTWKVVLASVISLAAIPFVLYLAREMWRDCSAFDQWRREHK